MKNIHPYIIGILYAPLVEAYQQNWNNQFWNSKSELQNSENKPIILVFKDLTGVLHAYKLDKEIWKYRKRLNYAAKNYVMRRPRLREGKPTRFLKVNKSKNNQRLKKY